MDVASWLRGLGLEQYADGFRENRIGADVFDQGIPPALVRRQALARQQQAKSWEQRTATSYARLLRDQARVREAHDLLAPVYAWFTEGFNTADLKEAKGLLNGLR